MLITSALTISALSFLANTDRAPSRFWRPNAIRAGSGAHPVDRQQMAMLTMSELNADLCDFIIEYWLTLLEEHDPGSMQHALRVTRMSGEMARGLGLAPAAIVNLQRGALLHDIGKLFIPTAVLHKRAKLNDDDWTSIHQHPARACDLIASISHLESTLDVPRSHHERWDGTGYPDGLSGESIPMAARIFAVADVWDALTRDRPYRAAWSTGRAFDLIKSESGRHFDPAVVRAFLNTQATQLTA